MPEDNTALLDAEEFKKGLIARTQDSNDKEGLEIKKYLDDVAPNWEGMRATRLYTHIQGMLKSAEENRCFEIELVWKRAIYFAPIMLAFFTAYGGVFFLIFVADFKRTIVPDLLLPVLFLIALASAFLSFYLAKINLHSHRWQRNWEHHVEYLQAIMGMKLMQTCLEEKAKFSTIGKINVYIGFFIFAIWILASLFPFLADSVYARTPPFSF